MEQWEPLLRNIIEFMGCRDYTLEVDEAHHHGTVFIHDTPQIKEHAPLLVESLNHLIYLIAKKNGTTPIFLDVNNYRKERENLIVELTKAAARKALTTKQEISLPAMNAYERRLAHLALAAHPEVTTESCGAGRSRYVIIKLLKEEGTPNSLGNSFVGEN